MTKAPISGPEGSSRNPSDLAPGVAAYVAAVASRAPAPGGGSVLGVTAALAAGLGAMVCRFTGPVADEAGSPHSLDPVLAELDRLRAEMLSLASADEAAYGAYRAAAGLAKGTDQERAQRRSAMQAALVDSTEVPLAVARGCRRLLDLLAVVAASGNPHLRSDAEIGALLAEAALRGSLINVRGNVMLLKDPAIAAPYRAEAESLDRGLNAGAIRGE